MDPIWKSFLRSISLVTQVGISVVVSLLLGIFLGRWIDDLLGTRLIATGIGVIIGLAAGISGAYQLIKAALKDDNNGKSV